MITLRQGFLSIFVIAMVFAIACDSEITPIPGETPMTETPLTAVAQTSDCPGCLLRERVASAQPGDTINIAAGIYTMTGGELVIDKDLTLVGAGAESTVIQAADSLDEAVHRVIRITEHSIVSISGVTIRYGSETSTEARMIPFHSEAIGMPESGIEAIRAEFGGGIYNQGTLTLIDSIVSENYAGGGAGIFNGAKVIIKNSAIRGNRTRGFGAGIFNGGILLGSDLVIEGNAAGGGGGLSNWGEASLVTTTIDGNRSKISGGGFHNNSIGIMTLDSSTVSNNEAALAGGINNWGRLQVINSTISHNKAKFAAGIDSRGVLTLTNSTVSGNSANEGGGLVVRAMVRNDGVSMTNTILAGNTAAQGPDCIGVVISRGHNLVGVDGGCGFVPGEGDTMGTTAQPIDPRLGGLAANGGATDTRALLPGSPAIDAASGSCPPVDQRGVLRPRGASCDIGAYER